MTVKLTASIAITLATFSPYALPEPQRDYTYCSIAGYHYGANNDFIADLAVRT